MGLHRRPAPSRHRLRALRRCRPIVRKDRAATQGEQRAGRHVQNRVWASWNYLAQSGRDRTAVRKPCVTYWMNRLQGISDLRPCFVTLSPLHAPAEDKVIWRGLYQHPLFNAATLAAQKQLWSLQGEGNTWFCGPISDRASTKTPFRLGLPSEKHLVVSSGRGRCTGRRIESFGRCGPPRTH